MKKIKIFLRNWRKYGFLHAFCAAHMFVYLKCPKKLQKKMSMLCDMMFNYAMKIDGPIMEAYDAHDDWIEDVCPWM